VIDINKGGTMIMRDFYVILITLLFVFYVQVRFGLGFIKWKDNFFKRIIQEIWVLMITPFKGLFIFLIQLGVIKITIPEEGVDGD